MTMTPETAAKQGPGRPERPASIELSNGFHQIIGRSGSANCYLVRGSRKTMLIDTGLPQTFGQLEAELLRLGMPLEAIDIVVLTHEHFDHSAMARRFQETALLAAHPLAAGKIAMADEFALLSKAFSRDATEIVADIELEEGARIDVGGYRFTVIHTPGHCSGHVSLFESDKGILIGGDAVFKGGLHGGILGSGNVSDYIRSLDKLAGLKLATLAPGHGEPSTDPYADIAEARRKLEALHLEMRAVFGTLGTGDQFQQILASLKSINK